MVPRGEDATAADAKAGEAFFILGSLIHSGGPNISQQRRPLHSFFWIRSYLRPEVASFFSRVCSIPESAEVHF